MLHSDSSIYARSARLLNTFLSPVCAKCTHGGRSPRETSYFIVHRPPLRASSAPSAFFHPISTANLWEFPQDPHTNKTPKSSIPIPYTQCLFVRCIFAVCHVYSLLCMYSTASCMKIIICTNFVRVFINDNEEKM